MSIPGQDISNPGNQSLENYFSYSIVPQLFIDSEMVLRSFTSPAAEIFSLSRGDIGKSLYNLKDKLAHNALIDNIRGVLLVEKNKEKEIQTLNGQLFNMNVQPYFGSQDEQIIGVIVTYLELTGKILVMKELEKLNTQYETLMFGLSQDIKQPLSSIVLISENLLEAYEEDDKNLIIKCLDRLQENSKNIKLLIEKVPVGPILLTNKQPDEKDSLQNTLREKLYTFYR